MGSKKNNPFRVPKDYFDSLEKKLLEKNQINFDANGYKAPKDYFDILEKELLRKNARITNSNKSKIFKRVLLTISGIAASLLVFYNISYASSSGLIVYDEKEEASEDFIEIYYLEDFDSYKVLSMLDENEIENTLSYTSNP